MKITQTTITIKDIISKVANTATTILLSLLQLLAQVAPSDDALNIVYTTIFNVKIIPVLT